MEARGLEYGGEILVQEAVGGVEGFSHGAEEVGLGGGLSAWMLALGMFERMDRHYTRRNDILNWKAPRQPKQ